MIMAHLPPRIVALMDAGVVGPHRAESRGRTGPMLGVMWGVTDDDDGDGVGATSARTAARVRARAGRRLRGRGINDDPR